VVLSGAVAATTPVTAPAVIPGRRSGSVPAPAAHRGLAMSAC
jgi:hypothetical protein